MFSFYFRFSTETRKNFRFILHIKFSISPQSAHTNFAAMQNKIFSSSSFTPMCMHMQVLQSIENFSGLSSCVFGLWKSLFSSSSFQRCKKMLLLASITIFDEIFFHDANEACGAVKDELIDVAERQKEDVQCKVQSSIQ
jgi:hypothetical protein